MIFGYMYKDFEKYTHLALFGISAITIINVNYDYNYSANLNLIKYYLLGELFILPSKKKDIFAHHLITIGLCSYLQYYNIDMTTNFYSTKQLLMTEVSSLFLSIVSYIKSANMQSNIAKKIEGISMVLFILSFGKYRIYDYYNNIITNDYFYETVTTNDSHCQYFWKYSVTYGLFLLNIYWFAIITKVMWKRIDFYFSYKLSEYFLQYSYFICTLTTIFTYMLNSTDSQKNSMGEYYLMDVISNGFLAITSYKFHNYLYKQFEQRENFVISTNEYLQFMGVDIIAIHLRAITQVYVHLKIHNLDNTLFSLQIAHILSCIWTVSYIVYSFNELQKRGETILYTNRSAKYKTMDIWFGLNPFIGIIFSVTGVYGETYNTHNTLICLYLISLVTWLQPFYSMNHLAIHILFIFLNFNMAMNNIYIKND